MAHLLDSDDISDTPSFSEALKAIFSTPELDTDLLELLTRAGEKRIKSIRQLADFCFEHFTLKTPTTVEEFALRDQRLNAIKLFYADTEGNAQCYKSEYAANPGAIEWPNPAKGQSIYETDIIADVINLIDNNTPIGSAGSCFAMEIAHWMQTRGFNYIVTEENIHTTRRTHWSSARWGTIFNVPAFRQLIETSFGLRTLPKYIWQIKHRDGRVIFRDPFREEIDFGSPEEYEANIPRHREAARSALTNAKVFILTLGLTEVWSFRADGSVLSRNPWQIAPAYVKRKVLDVADNVRELQLMLDIWRRFNPDIKLIISVSPVPMMKTFRGDRLHVVAATAHSKATLRVAAQQFCDANEGVYYFPSFEKIMYGSKDPWEADHRHVRPEAVDGVMKMFRTAFAPRALVQNASTNSNASQCGDVDKGQADPINESMKINTYPLREWFAKAFTQFRGGLNSPGAWPFLARTGRQAEMIALSSAISSMSNHWSDRHTRKQIQKIEHGYQEFAKTGITPGSASGALRHLFSTTNGKFNQILSDFISRELPPKSDIGNLDILGNRHADVINGLNSNGYWIFNNKLSSELVEELLNYAKTSPAIGRETSEKPSVTVTYLHMKEQGNGFFQFDEDQLVQNPTVWKIASDPQFLSLARSYLGCEPVLDLVAMWWSLAIGASEEEKSRAAQLYHFDIDRLSFIKLFVYLTDVTEENGPHCYVSGSHRGFRGDTFLKDGRFSDAEVKSAYPVEEVKICGPKGTVFMADTKGLHKGMPLAAGERLIFQIEFSNSLFGAPYVSPIINREMNNFEKANPSVFSKFRFTPQ